MSNTFVFSHHCTYQASPVSLLYWLIGSPKKSIMHNTVTLQSKTLFKGKFWLKSYWNVTFLYTLTILKSFGRFCFYWFNNTFLFFNRPMYRIPAFHLEELQLPPINSVPPAKMPFLGQDWRSPGWSWTKTEVGWQRGLDYYEHKLENNNTELHE